MSAATMPTKNAGSSSIPSMKRSMRPRLTTTSGFDWAAAMTGSAIPQIDVCADQHARERAATASAARAGGRLRKQRRSAPAAVFTARRLERARRGRCRSVRRLVLGERLLELLHDGIRIATGLADVVGPLLLQRLGRLLPFVELRVSDRVDLVRGLGFHLGQSGVLEIRPGIGEFTRPLSGAVVVDDL